MKARELWEERPPTAVRGSFPTRSRWSPGKACWKSLSQCHHVLRNLALAKQLGEQELLIQRKSHHFPACTVTLPQGVASWKLPPSGQPYEDQRTSRSCSIPWETGSLLAGNPGTPNKGGTSMNLILQQPPQGLQCVWWGVPWPRWPLAAGCQKHL